MSRANGGILPFCVDRQDIFRRDIGLEVVGGGDDVAAAAAKGFAVAADFPADFGGRAVRQQALGVDPAVEAEPVAKVGLQALRQHRRADRLDGIQHVHAQGNQVGNERPDLPAAMIEHLGAEPVDAIEHLLQIGSDEFAEGR